MTQYSRATVIIGPTGKQSIWAWIFCQIFCISWCLSSLELPSVYPSGAMLWLAGSASQDIWKVQLCIDYYCKLQQRHGHAFLRHWYSSKINWYVRDSSLRPSDRMSKTKLAINKGLKLKYERFLLTKVFSLKTLLW